MVQKQLVFQGKDSAIINATPKDDGKFGYTGDITKVNGEMIKT